MKKIFLFSGACLLLLIVVVFGLNSSLSAWVSFADEPELTDVNTNYEVEVEVYPDTKTGTGTMTIHTKNDTGQVQDRIFFQVLANKFLDSDTLEGDEWKRMLGPYYESGGLEFEGIQVDGKDSEYTITDTMLEIPLDQWDVGEVINVSMDFTFKVPYNDGLFSYNNNSIYFASWLPTRAVYNENGWYMNEFPPIGDPSYNDMADYSVTVTIPKDHHLASTGQETAEPKVSKDKKTYSIHAEKVREFAMSVLDETFKVHSEKVDGITLRTWYTPKSKFQYSSFHLTAKNAIQYFNESFGEYPYKEFEIVPGARSFLGMEYPGFTLVHERLYNHYPDQLLKTIAHEVAHQWWYGAVGNHTIDDPWLDESLTSYSTLQFLSEYYPNHANDELKKYEEKTDNLDELKKNGQSITSSTTEYSNSKEYVDLVYAVGPQMFYKLEEEIGVEKMNEALAHYYRANKDQFAEKEDLIEAFKMTIGPEAEEYFNEWLNNRPVTLAEVR
ncbi:M1 family metallopeptidase [Guptibacillus algicola]|uniref:M1 family metallopeptidase n=1 Tax=Guptibacillus algicola TaxID=225844 RepID=UPI001CD3AEDD|nr:M1 family metallopeptidase [Alkalihalobacillus algicola]MCA0987222.1 M1 family metallopeptidase [Alkalihalobacillus algicola]